MASDSPIATSEGTATEVKLGTSLMSTEKGANEVVMSSADKSASKENTPNEETVEQNIRIKANRSEERDAEVCEAQKNDAQPHDTNTSGDDVSSTHPYVAGQTLQIHMDEDTCVDAEILKVFEPFSWSCAMVVRLDTTNLKGEYVLKLYDRRFSFQLRKQDKAALWTPALESRYIEFANSGCASGFFEFCDAGFREDEYWGHCYENKSKWEESQHEAYLQFLSRQTYDIEKRAYDLLQDMQGKHVPRVFAHPWLQYSTSANNYIDSPGILMEYIEGYAMEDLQDEAPKEDWQYICEEAIQIVQLMSVRGVINLDIRPRSFTIRTSKTEGTNKPKVIMMDFGLCRLREHYESVQDFREMQATWDQEGAVGRVMERWLKGGFKWHESAWSWDLSLDFLMEHS